jgi:hypothetical protein
MSIFGDFEIETFQLGHDQWHACFRPIDRSKPIVIDGIAFVRRRQFGFRMVHTRRRDQGRSELH